MKRPQFGLRTLLIGIALVATVLGWLEWQRRTVHSRQTALAKILQLGGGYQTLLKISDGNWILINQGEVEQPSFGGGTVPMGEERASPNQYQWTLAHMPTAIRNQFGDQAIKAIWLPDDMPAAEAQRIDELFPEASMHRVSEIRKH